MTLTLPFRATRFRTGLLTAFMAMILAFAAGCETLGLPTADTINEKIAAAQGGITQVRVSATQLLTAKKISVADAENVLAQTDNAQAGLVVARALAAQDPTAANARLTMVATVLTAVQAYLATKTP